MNERIKELADKVERIRDLYNIGPVHRDAVEQFAELIVRDCINISTKVDKNPYVPDHDQAKKIIREIKQHFGVE